MEPAGQGDRSLRPNLRLVGPEDVGPLHRPEVGILRPLEEPLNELLPLVRGGIGKERAGLGGGGERADRIEAGAAEERGVVAALRHRNAERGEAVVNEPIDGAYLRRPHEGHSLARHDDPHRGDMAQMADEDRRVPRDHPRLEHAGGADADDPRGI